MQNFRIVADHLLIPQYFVQALFTTLFQNLLHTPKLSFHKSLHAVLDTIEF